jgi:hypothetical protein
MDIRAGFVPLTGMEEFTVVLGGGSCYSDMEGTYIATVLSGAGTSRGFGPGTNCPTSTTENFRLTLTVQLLSTSTGQLRTVTQTLTAPPGVNTLPGSQPVTATAPLKDPGAGVLSYRIFHQCPPDGENSALYVGTIAN